ncbi:PDZ domain-containing protein [Psychroserpens sp. NJDZ02]|uniref:PDZ domain-containing protein n=1 Tax=Psychroserpens sp. NJDZ02 TaxID=2570561 RepID=UPI0010A8CC4D|nr:PDZ domain-containing protein [Psychroserpens sp. NJDZ02]QCE41505.1 PDZ domain-containing protein [Psychroserpens sp. NJDZ02]
MKRFLPLVFVLLCFTTMLQAQINQDCKNTCTIDKIVYETAFLGVQFGSPCNKESDSDKGVVILKVIEGTAAADNKLQPYDLVVAIDDLEVNRRGDAMNAVKAYQPFDTVRFTILRSGKTLLKTITLGAKTSKVIQEVVCCDEAISSLSKENISLYPNPAVSALNIAFKEVIQGDYNFAVYMTNGVLVKQYNKRFVKGDLNENINVDKLEDGVYVLKITKDDSTYSNLFVVKRN